MKKILRSDILALKKGIKILRIVENVGKTYKSYLTITKEPYRRFCDTFQKDCDFVEVKNTYTKFSDKPYEYFINDLFNGDVYILTDDDILRDINPGVVFRNDQTTISDYKPEYVTDEDLKVDF